MDFLADLVREHGWHVVGELAVLVLAAVVAVLWIRALLHRRARPMTCSRCGRITSRAHAACPRCGSPVLESLP
jgi:predicted amidophosphoribosyltransferase